MSEMDSRNTDSGVSSNNLVLSPPKKRKRYDSISSSWYNGLSKEDFLQIKIEDIKSDLSREKRFSELKSKEIEKLQDEITIIKTKHKLELQEIQRRNNEPKCNFFPSCLDESTIKQEPEDKEVNLKLRERIANKVLEDSKKSRAEQIQEMGRLLAESVSNIRQDSDEDKGDPLRTSSPLVVSIPCKVRAYEKIRIGDKYISVPIDDQSSSFSD